METSAGYNCKEDGKCRKTGMYGKGWRKYSVRYVGIVDGIGRADGRADGRTGGRGVDRMGGGGHLSIPYNAGTLTWSPSCNM